MRSKIRKPRSEWQAFRITCKKRTPKNSLIGRKRLCLQRPLESHTPCLDISAQQIIIHTSIQCIIDWLYERRKRLHQDSASELTCNVALRLLVTSSLKVEYCFGGIAALSSSSLSGKLRSPRLNSWGQKHGQLDSQDNYRYQ